MKTFDRLSLIGRIALAFLTALMICTAHAQPILLLSHVQHFYAGGSGCADRFWLEWSGADIEISTIQIHLEWRSKGDDSLFDILKLDRLGTTAMDRTAEVVVETARCLSGSPRIVVRGASALMAGKPIDLLHKKQLRITSVEKYPVSLGRQSSLSSGSGKVMSSPQPNLKP